MPQPLSLVDRVIHFFLFVSPFIGFVLRTVKATYGGYSVSSDLVVDPGHKRIRVYDTLISLMSIAVGIYVFVYANGAYVAGADETDRLTAVLFPQFQGYVSFFILYATSFVLFFYDQQRAGIIRTINERKGYW